MISNYKLATIILVMFGASTLFILTQSQAVEKHSTDGGASCRRLMLVMAKRMMKVITNCTKEVKEKYSDNAADFQTHFQCTIKCFMLKVNMINEKQMLSNMTFSGFITDNLPLEYHELAYKVTRPCIAKYETLVDPNDVKCTAYGDFVKCLQEQATDHC